uniref:phage tail assembly chaperone n=1 Tax=uncultured Erythrobacter sp. TaxID=263913 RepID=UPI0026311E8C|nr:phage tail assembly chaperone [uncultured Erythrobacter sp.]
MNEATFADVTKQWCPLASQSLGWRPSEFWASTPGELALALSAPAGAGPATGPSREIIEHMMERDSHG